MTPALVQRIIWKEYRTFRGFWISIAVLTFLLQWFVVYLNRAVTEVPLEATALPFIALAMAVFYALGVGATLFNMEHEQETYQQLRAWPSTVTVVWLGKLLFALVSAAALGILLLLVTGCIWGAVPWWMFGGAVPIGATILSVAILCSLLIRRPLPATFVAGTLTFGAWLLSLWLLDRPGRRTNPQFPVELVLYGCIGMLGLLVSYPLARWWFADRPRFWTKVGDLPRVDGPVWLHTAAARSQLARMAWLSLRQLGWVWLGTLVAIGAIYLLVANHGEGWLPLMAGWPLVIGATLFAGDQSGRSYRFFAERSVSQRQLWWQRQVIGLAMCAITLAITLPPVRELASHLRTNGEDFPLVAGYVSYCVLAYSVGQLASLCLRSPLLSLTITGVVALPLLAWCFLATWFRLPWWLAAALPAVGLWTASRLRVGSWMLDRDQPRHWLAPVAALLAAALVTVGSFYLYRVYSIPWVEPIAVEGQVVRQRSAAEEKAVQHVTDVLRAVTVTGPGLPDAPDDDSFSSIAQMKFRGVTARPWSDLPLPIWHFETTWLQRHQEDLNDTFLRALEQVESIHPAGKLPDHEITQGMQELATLMVVEARQHQHSGNLAAALASYRSAMHVCDMMRPHGDSVDWRMAADRESMVLDNLLFWAAAKGQTGDQLQQAIDWSRDWLGREQEWTTPLMADVRFVRDAFAGLPWSLSELGVPSEDIDRLVTALTVIPGERQRWQRLLNTQAKSSLTSLSRCIEGVEYERHVTWIFQDKLWNEPVATWLKATPLVRPVLPQPGFAWDVLKSNVLLENHRRATQIRLRLIDWQLRHGSYPTAFEWQQANRNAPLPPDVLTGLPFRYEPDGLNREVAKYVWFCEPARYFCADASQQPLLASPEALEPNLDDTYSGNAEMIRGCIYPLPSPDVVLQYSDSASPEDSEAVN